MSNLNFRHLSYFRAVAHDGNLTRAAAALGLSQSALSVQIRTLEDRLGQRLFERRGRRLHLTEAGRIALDHADSIFATGEELVATLRQGTQAPRALRVGALATLSRNFQIGFLRPLLGREDVAVILRSGRPAELLQGLEALNLDVVLMTQPPTRETGTPFISHRLAEQRVSLVGTPSRLKAPRPGLAALLATQPVILPTPDSTVRIGFDALADRLGVRPRIAAEVEDMALIRLLAREDVGLAVVTPVVVRDELASGLLVEGGRLPGLRETFYAVTLDRRFPNPLLRSLLPRETAASDGVIIQRALRKKLKEGTRARA